MHRKYRRVGLIVVGLLFVAVLAPVAVYAAGGTFTDDDTSVFEADIEWMASTGITFGCNPPTNDNYCPDKSVTRGQMAAFMHRLADNQVVDAGKLGGEDPAYYQSLVFGNDIAFGLLTTPLSGGNQRWAEIDIELPAAGMLMITASVSGYDPDSEEQSLWWLQIDDSSCKNSSPYVDSVAFGYLTVPSGKRLGTSFSGVTEITSGPHSVTLCARGSAGNTQVYEPTLTALFSTGGEVVVP